jgi:exopolyphosphatase / guanosine-5'-triphosphate,3'-diphosphate pyrophosphatase
MQNGTRLAAVDLGSNSFRLEIGFLDHGQIHRTEYLKETVRQGNGLDEDRNLTHEAMQRGWDCLARFGERLSGFKTTEVRAVATQTLREARNREVFLTRACEILGFPIDVISGPEEARLIYQGVANLLPESNERRLVIDIGGRSTELILGQHLSAQVVASYRVGSVKWSMKYFANGQINELAFNTAEIAAKAVLDETLNTYKRNSWDFAYGSSGTIGAVCDVLKAAGVNEHAISREGLLWLREKLLKSKNIDQIRLAGLKEDRRSVFAGGVSILCALFDLLDIQEIYPADGALRHGAIYDLIERDSGKVDTRNASVERLAKNFRVDFAQANRVEKVAQSLFEQIESYLVLDKDSSENPIQTLRWAAQLHEIGCQISHSDYHKHGAYILDNADASGFDLPELHRLSMLVLGHRGKLKKLELELNDKCFAYQLISLRIAVILCHARRDSAFKAITLLTNNSVSKQFSLTCPDGWSTALPQSAHLLREEVIAWSKLNWKIDLEGCEVLSQ